VRRMSPTGGESRGAGSSQDSDISMMMVDGLKIWTRKRPFHRGSCHLTTDETLDALHAFAARIGMRRQWFQDHPYAPHYDLVPERRELALQLGAVYVNAVQQGRMRRARGIGMGLRTLAQVSAGKIRRASRDVYRCQFCEHEAPAAQWAPRDECPKCGRVYDAMLAQEGDDG
jgi:hypothetical protein